MDSGILDPKKLGLLHKDKGEDFIGLAPTFYGDEYTNSTAYLKFNNAIKRMAEPREVERNETDVEFIARNEEGSIYAVAYHYADGRAVQTDMLTKTKNGGWRFHNFNTRYHPNFVSAYVSSIWGYKKPTEQEMAQVLAEVPAFLSKMIFVDSFVLTVFPGGFDVSRYKLDEDDVIASIESIDFIPYENITRDDMGDFYLNDVLPFCVYGKDLDAGHISEDLVMAILKNSLGRLRKKYGDKEKFSLDEDSNEKAKVAQKV